MKAHWPLEPDEELPREIPFRYQLLILCAMVWALVSGVLDGALA